ncbi:hypothetical protein BT63DRAFT_426349 [Microthyrium microscopicum]|uniref:Uncharacterized protein n=1 Tax=Microthyrium microscopicum TaxID=703497 RepID=A0A6A6U5D1_9PEZI|nr:hypothetical protein BT63DRAFT_426349 [Microthyrium microscopicum]
MTVVQGTAHDSTQDLRIPSYCEVVVNPGLSISSEIWSILPRHITPTCALDRVVTEIIQTRRTYEIFRGNDLEFSNRPFPSVQSLLNPKDEMETQKSPVTSSIVNNIIQVMTVPTLPEQIAILFFMGSVIRWLVSPTPANYYSMPEWLRPTPSQLSCPHPVWIDLFIWPKARDRMSREPKYHGEIAIMTEVSNASLCVNWPFPLSDMLSHDNGPEAELVLNPTFERHIRDLKNWSVGPRMFEV